MKPKILITDKLDEKAVNEAKKFADVELAYGISHDELLKKIENFDAIVVRSGTKVTRDVIEKSKLKVIGRAGVGLDNIDLKAAYEKGIVILNSPEAATSSVAELVFGSLICLLRGILKADKSVREGKWERTKFMGYSLKGKTIGIIGFGNIGKDVAKKAKAFGMKILAYDPKLNKKDAENEGVKKVSLDELIENSDIVTLHVPLTEETKNLLDKEKIGKMKNSAVLLNFSRGEVVDEYALFEALSSGKIRGAALDVFKEEPPKDSPLLKLENVVLTPHLGASTYEAQEEASLTIIEKIRQFFTGK
ncbi:MAG: hydroxyacid dehydrogenase [Candidatus Altiarchaeota archaeon]